jgi:hypothetical protein
MPLQQQYNKEFAKQFRHENFEYPAIETHTVYNHVLINQYGGLTNEMAVLAPWLSEKLHNTELVRCIIDKLENKDIPHSFRLLQYTKELGNLFNDSIDAEPYTARYYDGLITSLQSFCDLVSTFGEDMHTHLSCNLKQLNEGQPEINNSWDIDSSFTNKILEVVAFYNNHIQTYHSYFSDALQHESSNGKGIQVTTKVAHYLEELIALTEKMMTNLDDTREMLVIWEMEMDCRSDEELYN